MNRRYDDYLFSDGDLDATLRNHGEGSKQKVEGIPKDHFLSIPIDDVVANIVDQLTIIPLVIYEESMEMEQEEIQIDVSHNSLRNPFGDRGPINVAGIRVTVSIPYSGDRGLWKLRSNSWRSSFPRGKVQSPGHDGIGQLKIVVQQPIDEPKERIKQELDSQLNDIKFYLRNQKTQIEQYNSSIPSKVEQIVKARRERLKKHDGIADFLGIPLKKKEGAPDMKTVQIAKKIIRPLPPAPSSSYKPEPGIARNDYDHILSVIRHEGRTFETTPKTYAIHDEEELRDIILAHLNGHYKGSATGETFRKKGKTDIRIEDENRAAFVAECKIWKGAKSISDAIDQLLGYLTWRDCKSSIIIFNKHNAKFSEILNKIPDVFASHSRFKKNLGKQIDGEWRYSFMSEEDDSRLIEIQVFIFNIFCAE